MPRPPDWLPRWYWLVAPVPFAVSILSFYLRYGWPPIRGRGMNFDSLSFPLLYHLPIALGLLWLFWACPYLAIHDRTAKAPDLPQRRLRQMQMLAWVPVFFIVGLALSLSLLTSAANYLPPPSSGLPRPAHTMPATMPAANQPPPNAPSQFGQYVDSLRWRWPVMGWFLLATAAAIVPFILILNNRLRKGFIRTLRERQMCFQCGYDLRGTAEGRPCPECGWDRRGV